MMTDLGLASLAAHAAVAWVTAHADWVTDKAGGAVVSQGVKEGWEAIKTKLNGTAEGSKAVAAMEAMGGAAVEGLRKPLEAALASDPEFAGRLAGVILGPAYSQSAVGDDNIQNQVVGSSGVSISISR
jgi:hypothetical protein